MKESLENDYQGSSFREVRDQVFSDPYKKDPHWPMHDIHTSKLFSKFQNKLYKAAHIAVHQKHDIRPYFDKLIHSNGMGFSGKWEITEDSPYTGMFAKGSKALIVARISTILQATDYKSRRGFGIGVKLFPTDDKDEKVTTADLVLLDNFIGRKNAYLSDITITNHPIIGVSPTIMEYFGVFWVTLLTFPMIDMPLTYRPAFDVARVGVDKEEDIVSPTWVMVKMRNTRIKDEDDFRDELQMENQVKEELILDLYVSEHKKNKDGSRNWSLLGKLTLDESIVSVSTNHRLHFHHPKTKDTRFRPRNAAEFVEPSDKIDIRI